jgi:hypothetical protein
MELQEFCKDDDLFFSIVVDNFVIGTDLMVVLRRGQKKIYLSPYVGLKLFRCTPKIDKLLRKISFEGHLSYFVSPDESEGVTSLLLSRNYDRSEGKFIVDWNIESMKFGDVYSEATTLSISRQLLRSMYDLRSLLRRTLSHWNEKVGHISEEIANGPKIYFTPFLRNEYTLLSEVVKSGRSMQELSLPPTLTYFLENWSKKEKM